MDANIYKKYGSFCGYMSKKSPSFPFFYQKRYWRIIDAKFLVYLENDTSKDIKGNIEIENIKKIESTGKT